MSEFKEWFLNQYKYCEEYFEITTFEDGKFKPVKSYHPEHQDTANLLNVALNTWNYQQAKIDELQKQIEKALGIMSEIANEIGFKDMPRTYTRTQLIKIKDSLRERL